MHRLPVAGIPCEHHLAQELVTYQVVVPDLWKQNRDEGSSFRDAANLHELERRGYWGCALS